MAHRGPIRNIIALEMFCPPQVMQQVREAAASGKRLEMESTSISDPGPDESRVMIDGRVIHIIPGY